MSSADASLTLRLDEEASAILLNLIAVVERLAVAMEQQQQRAARDRGPGPYMEGDGE
jgi:hypothetical protein